jgi:hypothetical protein
VIVFVRAAALARCWSFGEWVVRRDVLGEEVEELSGARPAVSCPVEDADVLRIEEGDARRGRFLRDAVLLSFGVGEWLDG